MCTSCSKKRAVISRSTETFSTTMLENVTFLQLYYTGDEDTVIPTVLSNVTYGKRKFGEMMYVAQQDYHLHPELWSESEPNNSNST